MMQTEMKTIFPQLPFETEIDYIEIRNPISIKTMENISNDKFICKMEQINNDSLNNVPFCTNKKKKGSVKMNETASIFKFSFYQIFTSRKKFPKKLVIMIHNSICSSLNLRKISRDESRSIDLYFTNFAQHSEKILVFIKNNKSNIIKKIPELRGIMNLYL